MSLSLYPVENYPLSYRRQAYTPLIEAIKGQKSLFVTSVTGMGKTHLLKFLVYRRELHRQAFGEDAERTVFVPVDFHGVGDSANLYATLLAETYRRLNLREKEIPASAVPAALVGELISTLVQEAPQVSMFVFVFDGLEMLYGNEADLAAFLKQLRVLRDDLGGAASFILGTKPPLPNIDALGGNFAYLLDDPPLVWLPLLTAQEMEVMAAALAPQLDLPEDAPEIKPVLDYVGGHPRLLKECLVQLSRGKLSLENPPETWRGQLQSSSIIQRLCRQIWRDLPLEEQALLQAASLGQRPIQPIAGTIVHQIKLLSRTDSGQWRIASPLFNDYVKNQQPRPSGLARRWISDVKLLPHEFRYRNLSPIRLRPKEYDIMKPLVETGGEVVARDALIDAAWPADFETGVQEDANLNAVISGLRRKLKKADYPFEIKGIRKRGYQLRFQV